MENLPLRGASDRGWGVSLGVLDRKRVCRSEE
jgi:hypothetical protein